MKYLRQCQTYLHLVIFLIIQSVFFITPATSNRNQGAISLKAKRNLAASDVTFTFAGMMWGACPKDMTVNPGIVTEFATPQSLINRTKPTHYVQYIFRNTRPPAYNTHPLRNKSNEIIANITQIIPQQNIWIVARHAIEVLNKEGSSLPAEFQNFRIFDLKGNANEILDVTLLAPPHFNETHVFNSLRLLNSQLNNQSLTTQPPPVWASWQLMELSQAANKSCLHKVLNFDFSQIGYDQRSQKFLLAPTPHDHAAAGSSGSLVWSTHQSPVDWKLLGIVECLLTNENKQILGTQVISLNSIINSNPKEVHFSNIQSHQRAIQPYCHPISKRFGGG